MNDLPTPASERSRLPWVALLALAAWGWAIWSCAEHWRNNPNYSYGWAVPILAAGFALRRWFLAGAGVRAGERRLQFSRLAGMGVAIVAGAMVFGLEYARDQMWHPEIVLWTICFFAIGLTFFLCGVLSDWKLARAEAFPLLFFLSAVPWPPRFEQPITSALIRWVAAATTEMLHWLGIQAQTSGGAVALQSGLVGITEACSGVRSLQAGIMFGLAMGEWFLLRPARRVFLLLVAVVLALGTNLVRTLTLTLEAERHGVAGLERVHDLVGNIIITALVLAIWMVGKLLSKKRAATGGSIVADRSRWQHFGRHLFGPVPEGLPMVAMAVLAGIFGARLLYARVEAQDQTQTAPFFMARTSEAKANRFVAIPYEIWNELRPTSGEYIRHDDAQLPGGGADCFHFFWKPSAWNRFALIHRPDICMPGVGWESSGAPEPRDLQIDGRSIKVYLFRFHRGNAKALELWGAWRNGEPVSLDYQLGQIFGTAVPPKALQLEGKRRSATEIVACSVIADGAEPAPEIALAILPSVFNYRAQ